MSAKGPLRATSRRHSGLLAMGVAVLLLAIMGGNPATLLSSVSGSSGPHSSSPSYSPLTQSGTIIQPLNPYDGVVDPSSGHIFVSEWGSNSVAIYSNAGQVLASVAVGVAPLGIAIDPITHDVYVANSGGSNLTVVHGLKVKASISVGPNPDWVLYDPVSNRIYATTGDSNLTVLSPSTYAILGRVALGNGCSPQEMAYDPSDALVYVTLANCNRVVALHATDATIAGTVTVGNDPVGIAYDSSNSLIYTDDFSGYGGNSCGALSEVSGLSLVHRFFISNGCDNFFVGYYPVTGVIVTTGEYGAGAEVYRGSTLVSTINYISNPQVPFYDGYNGAMYVPDYGNNAIYDINGIGLASVQKLFTGDPSGIVTTPTGSELIARYGAGQVAVVSEATNKVIHTIGVGSGPYELAYDSSTHTVYLSDSLAAQVTAINSTTFHVVATVTVGSQPEGITYDPADHALLVANFASNTLSVIDDRSNLVVATVAVGHGPQGVVASGGTAYVANSYSSDVSIVRVSSHTVLGTYPVGAGPDQLAIADGDLFVANFGSGNVSVVNLTTGQSAGSLGVGGNPTSLTVLAGTLYVADPASNAIYAFATSSLANLVTLFSDRTPYFVAEDAQSGYLFASDFLYNNAVYRFAIPPG